MSPHDIKVIEDASKLCTHLECDGTVKVLHYIMNENSIPHKVIQGSVEIKGTGKGIPLHFWIQLQNKQIVDYKAQMWLGKNAPNGIFAAKDYPNYIYRGEEVNLNVPKIIFDILTMSF